jgi:hypothetical protein
MSTEKRGPGFMELAAIAALVFLLWKKTRTKKLEITEPATTEAQIKDEFSADPNFNLNDYCKNVIYKPLSTSNLTSSNLLGEGWCYRGDRSAIDESKGFGDAYAEEQAKKYETMKSAEATIINNKLCVQFRLINSTAAPLTTEMLNTTQDIKVINGVDDGGGPIPNSPVATDGSSLTSTSFIANLNVSLSALGYLLDVATDSSFLSYVSGYQNKDIGNSLSFLVDGLTPQTNYYYRVRAYNDSGISGDSNIINVLLPLVVGVLNWDGLDDKVTFPSHADLSGNKTIKFNLWLTKDSGFAENALFSLGASLNNIYVVLDSSDQFRIGIADDITLGSTKWYSITGLANQLLACEIIKTAHGITSFKINSIARTQVGMGNSNYPTVYSTIGVGGDGVIDYLVDAYIWDIVVVGVGSWAGNPIGNIDASWVDGIGSINGVVSGNPSIRNLP